MHNDTEQHANTLISSLNELAQVTDYSLLNTLHCDPEATQRGDDYRPRQVYSGHYVPVKPTPISHPEYVAHSATFFNELGFDQELAQDAGFQKLFSGDTSSNPETMHSYGWATGYALSIYGQEYYQQCPFHTGNGYGDGRAMSILEIKTKGKRWEMQLKGGGPTPYCRGADGRAVLRSSVREFLAQEHMHALGIPTSRSLSLFVSKSETVDRPWYSEGSNHYDPDIMVANPVAITTRVAPSFLRVGQIELFARRARKHEHEFAIQELEVILKHLIEREYPDEVNPQQTLPKQLVELTAAFRARLISLVTNWLRVGYCQGNFNSDNCAAGGFTLDYGPFGFCENFDPFFQPWTGGGRHFSFFNQPAAAAKNFDMFCQSIQTLLESYQALDEFQQIETLRHAFPDAMEASTEAMWAAKLGLDTYDAELFISLLKLMVNTSVDYNMFFRELSAIPEKLGQLEMSFYRAISLEQREQWSQWLNAWRSKIQQQGDIQAISETMQAVNPKYTWREWLVFPAYERAEKGDYSLIHELQAVLTQPYFEQTDSVNHKFYQLRPSEYFEAGGIAHYSCSS